MLRIRLIAALRVALLGAIAVAWPISAQQPDPAGSLGEVPLPGGLRGALQAIGDPSTPDRSQFLLEFIRRTYSGRSAAPKEAGGGLPALVAYLERSTADGAHPGDAGHGAPVDTLPLGLPASVWRDIVLGGRPAPHGLLSSILQSRNAALLYYGVLSLDDETRSWLAGQPELVAELRRGMSARSSPPPRRYASAAARCACPAERPPKDRGKRSPALA